TQGMDSTGYAVLTVPAAPAVEAYEKAIDELVRQKTEVARDVVVENTTLTNQAVAFMLGLVVFGMLAALGLGFFIARVIGRPVRTLDEAARRVTSGDLSASVVVASTDEVGSLGAAFNQMVENIKASMGELQAEKA